MQNDDDGAFHEYRRLILSWLEKIDNRLEHIEKRLSIMEVDLVAVRIKAGLWGAIAGAIPTAVAAFLLWLKNGQ